MAGRQQALVVCGASELLRNGGFIAAAQSRGLALIGLNETAVRCLDLRQITRVADGGGLSVPWEMHELAPSDEAGTLAILSECARRYEIRGTLALREDWVRWAALAADFFGLPSIGLRAAQVCRDKLLQRLYLARWSPRYQVIMPGSHDAPPAISLPAVLKPTCRSGSSGVRLIKDEVALRAQLAQYQPDEVALLEESVTGPEYSVETLVQDGQQIFESITAKRTNEAGSQYFVELAHTVPATSLTDADRHTLIAANHDILQALDVRDGITHAEYRLTNGRPTLMEINARLPGGSIPTLYRLAVGASLESAIVQIALGEPASYPQPRRYARQVYLDHPCGILKDVHVDDTLAARLWWLSEEGRYPDVPAVAAGSAARVPVVLVGPKRGAQLEAIRASGDRSVMFIADAPTGETLDEVEHAARSAITIEVS